MKNKIFFTSKDDGPSIEECIQNCKSSWKEKWKFCLHHYFKDDAHIWWKSFDFCEWRLLFDEALENYFYTNGLMSRIQKEPRVYFSTPTPYYMFMDVFIKKMSLFLLTLVANKFLSMFSWLIDCKFLQRVFKAHMLLVKMFKFLKI
jgi:hypothetical protein